MVFYLIGLGLGDPTDITVRGYEVVKKCYRVYLEGYTSILSVGKEALEAFYGREVIVADREQVEQGSDQLFDGSLEGDVALLVVGDPFSATTHTDLALRAHSLNIPFQVISNASIMTAIGCTGLQLYRFGETVSIPFWQDGWEPESFFDKINRNLYNNLHTLCLLDIKVKEQSLENYLKGRRIYEPPRYLRVHQAAQQLLTIVSRRMAKAAQYCSIEEQNYPPEGTSSTNTEDHLESTITDVENSSISSGNTTNAEIPDNDRLLNDKNEFDGLTESSLCVGAVRIGTNSQVLIQGTLKEMCELDLGAPLHSLIICGNLHPIEKEAIDCLTKYFNLQQTNNTKSKSGGDKFSIVGLGLGQPSDITMKGLKTVKEASKVYLEGYTSIMEGGKEAMEKFFGRNLLIADRELVEQHSDELFDSNDDVAFMVVGDPLSATTHVDLVTRALLRNKTIDIVHNASILNAAGCCGLQLYSFGETISIPFWQDNWKPDSFYDKICQNLENGWHTLCLLDIKVKEQTDDNLVKGRKIFEPPRYMTAEQASTQLVQIIKDRESCGQAIPLHCGHTVIALARIGTKDQLMKTTSLQQMVETEMGSPLHSLIIVGDTHPLEDEYINMFGR